MQRLRRAILTHSHHDGAIPRFAEYVSPIMQGVDPTYLSVALLPQREAQNEKHPQQHLATPTRVKERLLHARSADAEKQNVTMFDPHVDFARTSARSARTNLRGRRAMRKCCRFVR